MSSLDYLLRQELGPAVRGGVLRYVTVNAVAKFDPQRYAGCPRRWWFEEVDRRWQDPTKAEQQIGDVRQQLAHYAMTGVDTLGTSARHGKRFVLPMRQEPPRLWLEQEIGGLTQVQAADENGRFLQRIDEGGNDGADIAEYQSWHDGVLLPILRKSVWEPRYVVPFVGRIAAVNRRPYWLDNKGAERPLAFTSVELVEYILTSDVASRSRYAGPPADTVAMAVYGMWASKQWPDLQSVRLSHAYFQTTGKASVKTSSILPLETVQQKWEGVRGVVLAMSQAARESDVSKVEANYGACEAGGWKGCPYKDVCPRSVDQVLDSLSTAAPTTTPARQDDDMNMDDPFGMGFYSPAPAAAPPPAPRPSPAAAPAPKPAPSPAPPPVATGGGNFLDEAFGAPAPVAAASAARPNLQPVTVSEGGTVRTAPPLPAAGAMLPVGGATLPPDILAKAEAQALDTKTGDKPELQMAIDLEVAKLKAQEKARREGENFVPAGSAAIKPPDAPASVPPTNAQAVPAEARAGLPPVVREAVARHEAVGQALTGTGAASAASTGLVDALAAQATAQAVKQGAEVVEPPTATAAGGAVAQYEAKLRAVVHAEGRLYYTLAELAAVVGVSLEGDGRVPKAAGIAIGKALAKIGGWTPRVDFDKRLAVPVYVPPGKLEAAKLYVESTVPLPQRASTPATPATPADSRQLDLTDLTDSFLRDKDGHVLRCAVCGDLQYDTPSGNACKKGHVGAAGVVGAIGIVETGRTAQQVQAQEGRGTGNLNPVIETGRTTQPPPEQHFPVPGGPVASEVKEVLRVVAMAEPTPPTGNVAPGPLAVPQLDDVQAGGPGLSGAEVVRRYLGLVAKKEGALMLFVDCPQVVGLGEVQDLEGYVADLVQKLVNAAKKNGTVFIADDLRSAPKDSLYGFGKWQGYLADAVRKNPPKGPCVLHYVNNNPYKEVVVDALAPIAAVYVRGSR
jgi:hypothetical protein